MSASADLGLVKFRSSYSFAETVARLEQALRERGIQTFCRVDHSGEAARVGLSMPPTLLLIFGSPRAGTPLMVASPTLALDLPLKALIAEDEQGAVWVTCNSAEYLRERHNLAGDTAALSAAERLLAQVAGPVGQSA